MTTAHCAERTEVSCLLSPQSLKPPPLISCVMFFFISSLSFHQRYLLSEAEEHHQLFDLIEGMLEYEPSKRLVLADSLKHPFFENSGIGEAAGSKNWEGNRDISR